MSEPPMIAVHGRAQQEVPAEQAFFTVTSTARDRNQETTLARIAERVAALREIVEAHGVERQETGHVVVYPETKDSREKVVAYVATVSTRLTVSEFDGLGEFLLRLARVDQTQVVGPWWALRPDSRAGAEVRGAAVADALARARDYAAAVGARIERLVDIVEDGVPTAALAQPRFAASRSAAGPYEQQPPPELELDPPMQTVTAGVTVRVTITDPAFSG